MTGQGNTVVSMGNFDLRTLVGSGPKNPRSCTISMEFMPLHKKPLMAGLGSFSSCRASELSRDMILKAVRVFAGQALSSGRWGAGIIPATSTTRLGGTSISLAACATKLPEKPCPTNTRSFSPSRCTALVMAWTHSSRRTAEVSPPASAP